MTNLDAPVLKFDYLGTSPAIDHNGYTKGNLFHLASYRAGYRVMNMSAIDNGQMNEVAFFDTFPNNNNAQFNGAWSVYPYFSSGTIIISDIERGLFMVRLNAALNTTEIEKNGFVIAPNPATSTLTISSEIAINSVDIIDITGKIVSQNRYENTTFLTLNIETLQKGLYFVKINNTQIEKIIKQ